MFNALYPKVYRLLRERAGLTQEELSDELGLSRYSVVKVESGQAMLSEDQERRLLELARCTKEEFGEMLCQELSEYLDKRVGIDNSHGAYEPTTALAMAYALLREHGTSLPSHMRRTLNNRISTTQLMSYTYDKNNADLVELTQDCREALQVRQREENTTVRRSP